MLYSGTRTGTMETILPRPDAPVSTQRPLAFHRRVLS